MIQSMTGYGKAEVSLPDKKVLIEIKSLNSKNLDLFVKVPPAYREKELELRQIIAERLTRGKIDCSIYFELNEGISPVNINRESVKFYFNELKDIATELNVPAGESLLQAILRLPDIVKLDKPDLNESEWDRVLNGITEALDKMESFRNQEGDAMKEDLNKGISVIGEFLQEIIPFEKDRIEKMKEKIQKSLRELNLQDEIDRNRFEQELIYYIEKLDISEEKTRLGNHLRYFRESMTETRVAGKKLSFISQEIGREINTIGSKANDSDIQRIVVKMKDELEKIKEQCLNIL